MYVPPEDGIYKLAARFWRTPNVKGAANIPMFLDCYFWCGWPDDDDSPPLRDGFQNHDDNECDESLLPQSP